MKKEKLGLNIVYMFKSKNGSPIILSNDEKEGAYFIIYVHSLTGEIDLAMVRKAYEKLYGQHVEVEDEIGPFDSIETLKNFAMKLCLEAHAPHVNLLSTYDYNLGVERIGHIEDFSNIFNDFGVALTNPDFVHRKNRLLGRLFQDS